MRESQGPGVKEAPGDQSLSDNASNPTYWAQHFVLDYSSSDRFDVQQLATERSAFFGFRGLPQYTIS